LHDLDRDILKQIRQRLGVADIVRAGHDADDSSVACVLTSALNQKKRAPGSIPADSATLYPEHKTQSFVAPCGEGFRSTLLSNERKPMKKNETVDQRELESINSELFDSFDPEDASWVVGGGFKCGIWVDPDGAIHIDCGFDW